MNKYQSNSCCPPVNTVYSCGGVEGEQGPIGPTGPQGLQGEQGIAYTSNYLSLYFLDTSIIPTTDDDINLPYTSKIEGGDLQNITASIPGDGTVTLAAGHTYLIDFSMMANVFNDSNYFTRLKVFINGVQVPNPGNRSWVDGGASRAHLWSITTTTETTIRYAISPTATVAGLTALNIHAAYLNIIQVS